MESHSPRAAFTLPEVLLAIILFAIGVLGLASSATYIAEQTGEGYRQTETAHFAGSVLDSLRATPCHAVVSGAASAHTDTLTWSVAVVTQGRAIRATLVSSRRRGAGVHVFDTLIPCES